LKYSSEDYFSVIETKTGRKICDCGDEIDALMMVSFDPKNRTITRNQFLMGPVVDIEIPKQLPTTNITVSNVKENKNTPKEKQLEEAIPLQLPQNNSKPLNLL